MTHNAIGDSRVEYARRRLLALNPRLQIEAVPENVCEQNAKELVSQVDIIVDCAPLFEERFLLNRESIAQDKPLIECAIYDLEAHITTIVPGKTPCMSCLYPERPSGWKREFPVFGAVSGMVGCLGAMEAIKVLAGFGQLLTGKLLICDLREMAFRQIAIHRDESCQVCGHLVG